MPHSALFPSLESILVLFSDVKKCVMCQEYEGLSKCDAMIREGKRKRKYSGPIGLLGARW